MGERPQRSTPPSTLLGQGDRDAALALFYVHLPFAARLDTPEHRDAYERATEAVAEALASYCEDLGEFEIQAGGADDVMAWVQVPNPEPAANDGSDSSVEITRIVRDALDAARKLDPTLGPSFEGGVDEIAVGRAVVDLSVGRDPGRACLRGLRQAQLEAWDPQASSRLRERTLIDRALTRRAFEFHHQPIVDVVSQEIIAYEALCRGTMPDFRFPDLIFGAAERCDRVWALGRVLRDLAATSLDALAREGDVAAQAKLFINVHPSDIDDPVFIEQVLDGPLVSHAERVVFELTERAAISDYRRIKELFSILRRRGYRIAIDDLGSGYAGLTALAELEPEFIKFDMGLIRDIHQQPVKARLLERMIEFAREIGATTISEGVECAEERDALLATGAWAMQGYFFARPAPGFCRIDPARFEGLRAA